MQATSFVCDGDFSSYTTQSSSKENLNGTFKKEIEIWTFKAKDTSLNKTYLKARKEFK